ncbi:hypothetical protein D1115_03660 [Vibrio alfacsensis]|uniref:Uncharacterized protein n=1 Tax=Vibrio alfacsensis TaxID=1074311 RepID=A0ABM6YS01_9VIBR|nr:hypothetical protein [Vibrio alfacsensis]AXY00462.1 hypothetical protein D1115_03660 [Vibrio alfacsensis]
MIIDYNPAIIFDAVITSGLDGKLTPRYHGHPEPLVSAQGVYGVRVRGDFSSGLRARVSDTTKQYSLSREQVSNSIDHQSINYSVTCTVGCLGNNVLIDDGRASVNFTQLDNINKSESNIELMVHFENKSLNDLVNGSYNGHFQVLFEAQL